MHADIPTTGPQPFADTTHMVNHFSVPAPVVEEEAIEEVAEVVAEVAEEE